MDKEESLNNALVSIIVPVYNSEKTLSKCIDSLLGQTYRDIEVICVNDCSSDNSLDVIKRYRAKDTRVKLVNHEENKNAGGARNSGLKASLGVYICFVDNDDWLENDAIESMVSISDNFTIDIVTPYKYNYFGTDNKPVLMNLPAGDIIKQKKYGLSNGFTMLGSLIKKSLFIDSKLQFPEKIFYEDNPVAITILLLAQSIKVIERPLYYYYHSPGSVTGFTNARKISNRITTTGYVLTYAKERGLYTEELKPFINLMYVKLLCYTIVMICKIPFKQGGNLVDSVISLMREVKDSFPVEYLSKRNQNIYRHPRLFYYIASFLWKVKNGKLL